MDDLRDLVLALLAEIRGLRGDMARSKNQQFVLVLGEDEDDGALLSMESIASVSEIRDGHVLVTMNDGSRHAIQGGGASEFMALFAKRTMLPNESSYWDLIMNGTESQPRNPGSSAEE